MNKKKQFVIVLLLLAFILCRFAYYSLPVKASWLDEINGDCYVKVLPFYKGMEQDDKLKILNEEDILKLKAFLQNSTFSRMSPKDSIRMDSDTTYHITFSWSDGRSVQLRTFGSNDYGADTVVWNTNKLYFMQAHDENWHDMLAEQIADWS